MLCVVIGDSHHCAHTQQAYLILEREDDWLLKVVDLPAYHRERDYGSSHSNTRVPALEECGLLNHRTADPYVVSCTKVE